MRRTKLFALMITAAMCLGLCACSSGENDRKKFDSFRQELLLAQRISCRAVITANFGSSVSEFEVEMEHSGNESRITVLSPESIAGISARISQDSARLEFDGLVLDMGELTEDGLTPVEALPQMVTALTDGFVEYIWREAEDEKEYITVEITINDTADMQIWMDAGTMYPVYAQLRSDGNTIINCEFSQWTVE